MRINALSLLTIVFVTLKLCGVIGWSWWAVLSPVWGTLAFAIFLGAIALAIEAKKTPEQKAWDEIIRALRR